MAKATAPKDFESALAELETIVAQMESGKLSLEDSLAAYERGATLLNFCREAITRAEQQVEALENGVMKPFLAGNNDE
jgi:exodeoxyribonuclease VII small subunit